MMASLRQTTHIPVRPWHRDHRFGGRVILAAVEAMGLLAATVRAAHPTVDVRIMEQGRFAGFLEIPAAVTGIDALVELEQVHNGGVCARLLTKKQLQTMTRMTTHCEVYYGCATQQRCLETAPPSPTAPLLTINAQQVYQDLVPFGPAYRTLQDQLFLAADSAWGTVRAPELPQSSTEGIGSPFPLDGAMHAACVHGQRLVDFVPFPVGFAARNITTPTLPGDCYHIRARLRTQAKNELVYDLWIIDQAGQLRETIAELRMRDVSGGRIKPPAWIKKGLNGENGARQEVESA
jgi:hypothetical protein